LDRLNIDADWTVMFDFHESLMRPSDLFSQYRRRCNSFHVGADIRDFPSNYRSPDRVRFHSSIPLS